MKVESYIVALRRKIFRKYQLFQFSSTAVILIIKKLRIVNLQYF